MKLNIKILQGKEFSIEVFYSEDADFYYFKFYNFCCAFAFDLCSIINHM